MSATLESAYAMFKDGTLSAALEAHFDRLFKDVDRLSEDVNARIAAGEMTESLARRRDALQQARAARALVEHKLRSIKAHEHTMRVAQEVLASTRGWTIDECTE